MTDRQIEKAMAESILEHCGALVSISELSRHLGKSRNMVAKQLVNCKQFGEESGKRYYYEEVAEALCRQGRS